jgi:hypothetical protein
VKHHHVLALVLICRILDGILAATVALEVSERLGVDLQILLAGPLAVEEVAVTLVLLHLLLPFGVDRGHLGRAVGVGVALDVLSQPVIILLVDLASVSLRTLVVRGLPRLGLRCARAGTLDLVTDALHAPDSGDSAVHHLLLNILDQVNLLLHLQLVS